MKSVPVSSRLIQSVYFSQEDGQLLIRFHNGEERRFHGVAAQVVDGMSKASSPGQYYINNIRKVFLRLAA